MLMFMLMLMSTTEVRPRQANVWLANANANEKEKILPDADPEEGNSIEEDICTIFLFAPICVTVTNSFQEEASPSSAVNKDAESTVKASSPAPAPEQTHSSAITHKLSPT